MGRCLTEHYSASGLSTQDLPLQGQNAARQRAGNLCMRQQNIYPSIPLFTSTTGEHIYLWLLLPPIHSPIRGAKGQQRNGHAYDPQETLASVVDISKAVQVVPR